MCLFVLRWYIKTIYTLYNTIMAELYDARCSGHLGIKRTVALVKRDFYWPTPENNIMEYVKTCDDCLRNKPSNQRTPRVLQPLEISHHRWERVSIDFIT